MTHAFPGNSMKNITNARIEDISFHASAAFVTITYFDCAICQKSRQTLRLVVGDNTLVFDEGGNIISVNLLRTGMFINATISAAMTMSLPPQAQAFIIRIIRRR